MTEEKSPEKAEKQEHKTLIDALNAYVAGEKATRYETGEGTITFYSEPPEPDDRIYIHGIMVMEPLRRQGIFRRLLEHIVNKHPKKRVIGVLGVASPHLEELLRKFTPLNRHFANHGGDWLWSRSGEVCSAERFHSYVPETGALIKL